MTLHAAVLDQVVVSHPLATGPDVVAVDGISWTIERGSSWAVVGRSGSGKSSLLAVLSLMRRPTSGRLELLGTDIGRSSRREIASLRARNVGVVFQAYHLDDRQPLWWNVALPWVFAGGSSPADARRRAEDLLDLVGLGDLGKRRASELSGGQRQRVAIARALMASPALLVADEPTGNLDEETANAIADLLFALPGAAAVTVVVATHDLEVARRAEHCVEIAHGRFTASAASGHPC